MKLTKKKAIELHRELWDWLYHHPSEEKDSWPKWEMNDGDIPLILNDCFLCEYDYPRCCCLCPLVWPNKLRLSDMPCCDSYFHTWNSSKTPKTRKKYAKLIRDLKERK